MARLTAADKEEMVILRERGWSYARLAAKYGVSASAISWHCLKLCADPPNPPKPFDGVKGPLVMKRGGFEVRRFTPEEDATLLRLEREGASLSEIGRALGRRHNVVSGRLMTLARREERLSK